MISFRRFDKSDWMGYAGIVYRVDRIGYAEKLTDGSDPFIADIEIDMDGKKFNADVIVDESAGVHIYSFEKDGANCFWYHCDQTEKDAAALLRLEPVMTDLRLQELGFVREVG